MRNINTLSLFVFVLSIISISCGGHKSIVSANDEPKTDTIKSKKISISKTLSEKTYTDIDEVIVYYHKLKKDTPTFYNFGDESELNNFGYQLLANKKTKDAIEIFKLLVSEFPNSANPYDSLGEAYYRDKNIELSLKNYQKSLQLNPKNKNAEKWILNIQFENRDKNKFNKVYSKQQYLDDLDELAQTLTEINPHPYKFMDKEDFWSVVKEKKNLIKENTTYSEFIWYCSEIVANINCGHSGLWYFNQESEMLPIALRFPLEARLIDKRLYVSDTLINKIKLTKATEILSINGKSVDELTNEIFRHISSQGKIETTKRVYFNSYFNSYIPYSLNFPKSYTITIKGKKTPIKLEQLSYYKSKPRHFPTNLCEGEMLCLNFIEEKHTAVLTIKNSEYYGNRFSIFKEFIDDSFQKINSKGVDNLIIDMRSNGGGPGSTGTYLLRHLIKEAFTYKRFSEGSNIAQKLFEPFESNYKGKLYFLIDGEGGSTTGHILSIIKELKLATIIGEELGSNQFCTGGQKRFQLTNSSVFYSVGRYTHIADADSYPDDRGVMPDYFVTQSIQDYLGHIDTVMEYTINLIDKK